MLSVGAGAVWTTGADTWVGVGEAAETGCVAGLDGTVCVSAVHGSSHPAKMNVPDNSIGSETRAIIASQLSELINFISKLTLGKLSLSIVVCHTT